MRFFSGKLERSKRLIFIVFSFLFHSVAFTQQTSLRIQRFIQPIDTLPLDSLTIYPNSLEVFCVSGQLIKIDRGDYVVDLQKNCVILNYKCGDTLFLKYRVLPINLRKVYSYRDTSIIYSSQKGNKGKILDSRKLFTNRFIWRRSRN